MHLHCGRMSLHQADVLEYYLKNEAGVLDVGEIELNHERHAVTVSGKQVELTFKEYELLRYLMANKNIVLSRDSIVLKVWGTEFEGESRTVDMHIKTLRQKLIHN